MTVDKQLTELEHLARQRQTIAEQEPKAIADALRAGARVTDVANAIGRTREHVRRIARAHNIEPTR